jgi:hypothetical protein
MLPPDFEMRREMRAAGRTSLLVMVAALAFVAQAAGGKVTLARKYRPGQSILYVTKVNTNAKIDSDPPMLKNFFPPIPENLRMDQQTKVTVSSVHADGSADVQQQFDKFEITSEAGALPDSVRSSVTQAQQDISQRMVGQTVTVHYDAAGHLVDFEGTDELLKGLDSPVREPFLQMLRFYLGQMGGESLYPDHRVKKGEAWTRDLGRAPEKDYPFQVAGKSTMHYAGKVRYKGIKAAIVDYEFENTLSPAAEGLRKSGALPQLEAMGVHLEMHINGKGKGRVLVALDDGRVLQNHSTLHQTLTAAMKGGGTVSALVPSPKLEIQSDTELDVDGSKP